MQSLDRRFPLPHKGAPHHGGARLLRIGADGATAGSGVFLRHGRAPIGAAPDNDLVLSEPTVSGHHALVTRRFGRYTVADLGSTNGTLVNGRRIAAPQRLRNRDELQLGAVRLRFIDDRRALFKTPPALVAGAFVVLFAASFLATAALTRRGREAAGALSAGPAASARAGAAEAEKHHLAPLRAEALPAPEVRATPAIVNLARMLRAEPAHRANPPARPLEWLKRVNWYRHLAGVAAVAPDPSLSAGDRAHAHYLVLSYPSSVSAAAEGADAHAENPSRPGYSPKGAAAARLSDVDQMWTARRDRPGANWAIDDWMRTPFHRLPILSPRLHRVGYGAACLAGACAAALNTGAGADPLPPGGAVFSTPIEFPPNGSTMPFCYFDNEWPDPLSSCPDYSPPAGLAITIQTGLYIIARLGDYSVEEVRSDGSATRIQACGFDASTYANPDPNLQMRARGVLKDYGAVVIVPRHPLTPGAEYRTSATVDGRTYRWSFSISRDAPRPVK